MPAELTQKRALGTRGQRQQHRIGGARAQYPQLFTCRGVATLTTENHRPMPGIERVRGGWQLGSATAGASAESRVGKYGGLDI